MTERQSCGTCQWFQEQPHATVGDCTWEANHPHDQQPRGMFLLAMPNWGRNCTEWTEKTA